MITLIVDNYIIHKSRETQRWLKANQKFRVIYQPVYSPWVNHVERLWQALHETITRNHQCRSMWQLLKKVHHFMDTVSPFPGGKHGLAKVQRYQDQLFSIKSIENRSHAFRAIKGTSSPGHAASYQTTRHRSRGVGVLLFHSTQICNISEEDFEVKRY